MITCFTCIYLLLSFPLWNLLNLVLVSHLVWIDIPAIINLILFKALSLRLYCIYLLYVKCGFIGGVATYNLMFARVCVSNHRLSLSIQYILVYVLDRREGGAAVGIVTLVYSSRWYRCASALFQSQPEPPLRKSSVYRSRVSAWLAVARQPGVNLANTGKRRIFFYLLSSIIPFGSGRVGSFRRRHRGVGDWA